MYTKTHRDSAIPTKELISRIKRGKNNIYLNKIKNLADIGEKMIKSKNFDNKIFGEILNESWEYKKNCSNKISNNTINFITNSAKKNGAYASKIIGAGGGGFMIIYAEKKFQKYIKKNLSKFKFVDFKFSNDGSKVVYSS